MSYEMEHGYWIHTWGGEVLHSDLDYEKARAYNAAIEKLISEKDITLFPKEEVILKKFGGFSSDRVVIKLTSLDAAMEEIAKDRDGYGGNAEISSIYEREYPQAEETFLRKLGFFHTRKFTNYGKEVKSFIERYG